MRTTLLLLAALAAPALGQEEARIQELLRNLDDDTFEVREKAEKALIAIGEPALVYLKAAVAEAERRKEQTEVRVRAQSAIRAIELAAKSKQFYYEPKLITFQGADAEIGQVLAELEKQTGVRMDASSIDAKAKVSLNVRNAPLFKVLDDLCRGQDERSYEYRDDGVRFVRSRFVACPTAVEGPFRIRIVKLKQEWSTDFKSTTTQIQLSLETDWQKFLKPARKVDLEIRKATDDKGGSIEVQKAEDGDDVNNGLVAMINGRVVMGRGGRFVVRP